MAFTQKNVELINDFVQSHHTNPSIGKTEAFVLFDENKFKLVQHNIKIQTHTFKINPVISKQVSIDPKKIGGAKVKSRYNLGVTDLFLNTTMF